MVGGEDDLEIETVFYVDFVFGFLTMHCEG